MLTNLTGMVPNLRPIYQQMRTTLAQWVVLTDLQWDLLASLFTMRTIEPQAYLLLPGSHTHELLFVGEGLLRFYYPDSDGGETNKAFIAENAFAGPLAASTLDLPVIYGIQALEPTTLLAAHYTDFAALFDQDPVFDRVGRNLAERLLIHKELRARSLLQLQAKDRYLEFVEHHPHLVQRVPQYHIASYLGITEVSLSRLKQSLLQGSVS